MQEWIEKAGIWMLPIVPRAMTLYVVSVNCGLKNEEQGFVLRVNGLQSKRIYPTVEVAQIKAIEMARMVVDKARKELE